MSVTEERAAAPAEPLLRTLMGEVLRRTRKAQARTLQDVATQARISIAYLSEVERGRKEASSEVLVAVCRALDIRLVDLLARSTSQLLAVDLATDLGARRRRAAAVAVTLASSTSLAPDTTRTSATGPTGVVRLSVA